MEVGPPLMGQLHQTVALQCLKDKAILVIYNWH